MAQSENQKLFPDQFDDEQVLFVFRKHPIIMRKGLVFGLLGPLLGILPVAIWPQLGFGWLFGGLAAGFLLGGLILLPSWIGWYYSIYIVTDQRLVQISQKGFFRKSVVDIGLNKIQSINYEVNGFEETIFGFGTILVQTYMGDLVIRDVHRPAKINKRLNETLRMLGIEADVLENDQEEDE